MERDGRILTAAVEEYHLELNGVKFWTPYWVNWSSSPYFQGAPFAGKGTPAQIKQALARALAAKPGTPSSSESYRKLMRQSGLGIDCSGFAYHVLSTWLQRRYGLRLSDHVYAPKADILAAKDRPSWKRAGVTAQQLAGLADQVPISRIAQLFHKNPRRITNAARLTSAAAAVTVPSVQAARPGDLIKMTGPGGDHVGVITSTGPKTIRYTDSREFTQTGGGVRFVDITINDPHLGLEAQEWKDKADFSPSRGDRICRLRVIDERTRAI